MAEKHRVTSRSRRAILRGAAGLIPALTGCLSATDDVRSATFVHRGTTNVADTSGAAQSSDGDEYVLQEGGVRWDSFPVETVVGTSTIPDGVSETAQDAITAAFDAWNDVPGVGTVFASPTFDDSLTEVTGENGTNEFVWSSLDDGTLGRATIYWNQETRRLTEVDIRLNREQTWTTDTDATDAFDVQSLATHEVGHHGLDDVTASTAAEQTMYYETAAGNTRKRTLETGDIAGWQAAYGGVI